MAEGVGFEPRSKRSPAPLPDIILRLVIGLLIAAKPTFAEVG
jgi:hypothetical protein